MFHCYLKEQEDCLGINRIRLGNDVIYGEFDRTGFVLQRKKIAATV